MSDHPCSQHEEALLLYTHGECTAEEAGNSLAHAEHCPSCSELLAADQAIGDLMQGVVSRATEAPPRQVEAFVTASHGQRTPGFLERWWRTLLVPALAGAMAFTMVGPRVVLPTSHAWESPAVEESLEVIEDHLAAASGPVHAPVVEESFDEEDPWAGGLELLEMLARGPEEAEEVWEGWEIPAAQESLGSGSLLEDEYDSLDTQLDLLAEELEVGLL